MTTPVIEEPLAVRVARDVLENLDATELTQASYAVTDVRSLGTGSPDRDLRGVLLQVRASCEVCALGAFALGRAAVAGGVKVGDFFHRTYSDSSLVFASPATVEQALAGVLSRKSTACVEIAFQCTRTAMAAAGWPYPAITSAEAEACVEFGRRYADKRDRLRAIAENVVANNGEFVPPGLGKGA